MRRPRIALLPLWLAAACGGGSQAGRAAGPDSTCPVPVAIAAPTFRATILPALQGSCGSKASGCHGTAAAVGHVEFDSDAGRTASDVHASLVNAVPANAPAGMLRVAPGDPARSWLVAKITQDSPGGAAGTYGARMPYGGADVCAATVATIEAWILDGAPND
jgi:hypothetical protein